MNTEELKCLIASYLGIDPDQVHRDTIIDHRAINSLKLLKMYAVLQEMTGQSIPNYHQIHIFDDLLKVLDGVNPSKTSSPESALPFDSRAPHPSGGVSCEIGIDIENIDNLPKVEDDFRENTFYQQNFTSQEIAYCLLHQNPYHSLGGIFACKEAIVKADNRWLGIPLNQIEINHDSNGKPFFNNFTISISHSDNIVVAVALKIGSTGSGNK